MKKVLLLLLTSFLTLMAMADGHMKFKGIEMVGKASDFASQLQAKGYKYLGHLDNMTLLQGDFASYLNCEISLIESSNGDLVKVVVVITPGQDWKSIYQAYTLLCTNLTIKYGEPLIKNEDWAGRDPSTIPDDIKIHKFSSPEYNISSGYITPDANGMIEIAIKYALPMGGIIMLTYADMATTLESAIQIQDDL